MKRLYGKGQRPQPNQEPSIEQLSGLKALVDGGQCPYADFAIFQPYAARIMKRIKFSGLVITKSGALSQAEIYGPPDLDSWRSSYDVWANAMIHARHHGSWTSTNLQGSNRESAFTIWRVKGVVTPLPG